MEIFTQRKVIMSHPVAVEVEDEEIEQTPREDEWQAEAPEPVADWHADATQLYLNEIGQNALLTAVQERELAFKVQAGDFEPVRK